MHHSVFGLRLRADCPIPGLPVLPEGPAADVSASFGRLPPWSRRLPSDSWQPWYESPVRDGTGATHMRGWELRGGDYWRLDFRNGVEFIGDRGGTEVWCGRPAHLTDEDVAPLLLGIVLSFVLRLRGTLCLHASAVARSGRVIAFLGPEWAGKSTLAAALAGRGHAVVTDDLVALSERDGTFHAQPGAPYLRLRPSAEEGLRDAAGASMRLTPTRDNMYLDLDLTRDGPRFQREPLPLAVIYLLAERRDGPAAHSIEPVVGGERLLALLANTWATRMLGPEMRTSEFGQLGRLAAVVPLRRVRPAADPRGLARLCDAILADHAASPGGDWHAHV